MDFSVFSKEQFPQNKSIASGNSLEASYVEDFFKGRSQDEITLDLLKSNYSHDPAACITFMLPEAYAFFLPAYMRIALENYGPADAISDSVVFDLLNMAQGQHKDKLDAMLSSYTAEQLRAVAEFLNEMSEKHLHLYPTDDAKKALSVYWGRFVK